MTKKDYILIAEVVGELVDRVQKDLNKTTEKELVTAYQDQLDILEDLSFDLSDKLRADNKRFNKTKFLAACGVVN